ncbi:MAG: hypothetical protein ACKOIZ_08520, partial [Actinomycetota bacterium]
MRAADAIDRVVRTNLDAFEPKDRWAMDWYYPVMTGTMEGAQAKDRLASLWNTFAMGGLGIRCVSDEPWVTAAETAECSLAHSALGDIDTAVRSLWRYAKALPLKIRDPITMGEGCTPLVERRIGGARTLTK